MFSWLVQNTCLAAVMALVAGIVCRWQRLSPALCHALWLVVLIKLVTPPLISLPLPAAWGVVLSLGQTDTTSTRPHPRAKASNATVAAPGDAAGNEPNGGPSHPTPIESEVAPLPWVDEFSTGLSPELFADAELPASSGMPVTPREVLIVEVPEPMADDHAPMAPELSLQRTHHAATNDMRWDLLPSIIAWTWFVGSLGMAALELRQLTRFRRLVNRSRPAPLWLAKLVAEAARLVGVRAPRVTVTRAACSPLVFAFEEPRLLWPRHATRQLSTESQRAVLVHELAHLRRRDHWVGWLEVVCKCAWWWNPIFWIARGQIREYAELACDAWVVSVLPQGRRAYAQALIDVSQWVSFAAAPVPAVGMGHSARRTFERRLKMILRDRVRCRAPMAGLLALGLLALGALPRWSPGQQVAPEPAAQEPAVVVELERPADTIAELPTVEFGIEAEPAAVALPAAAAPEAGAGPPSTVSAPPIAVYRATRADPRSRLEQVEVQLQQLLREVQALRSGQGGDTAAGPQEVTVYAQPNASTVAKPMRARMRISGSGGHKSVMLSRTNYTLPAEKAQALATFLNDHVQGGIETKLDGDTLTVTASPDAQQTIGQFIQLMSPTAATAAGREWYRYGPPTSPLPSVPDNVPQTQPAVAPPAAIEPSAPRPADPVPEPKPSTP